MATIIIEIGNIHKINDSIEVLRVLESRAHPSAYESQIVADIIGILRGIQEAKSPIIKKEQVYPVNRQ